MNGVQQLVLALFVVVVAGVTIATISEHVRDVKLAKYNARKTKDGNIVRL